MEQNEQEEEPKQKKAKPNNTGGAQYGQELRNFFIDPNGGGPNWENWLKLALVGGFLAYYAWVSKSPSTEVAH